jgi:fatty acid desaturase
MSASELDGTTRSRFEAEDRQTRRIVRDLHQPQPLIYWTDLFVSAGIGWSGFAAAVCLQPSSAAMIAAVGIAVFALYRGVCFLHEISHIRGSQLPAFEAAWNLLIGYPMLMPSFVYVGVHQDHHARNTYGTAQDPEYRPFAGSRLMTLVFALGSFFIPIALLIRFVLLTPASFVSPRIEDWLITHASAVTMNWRYRREYTQILLRNARRQSAIALLLWSTAIILTQLSILPWRIFVIWIAVSGLISFVNALRTLGAHAYSSSGDPMDRAAQLADSINTQGALLTELWAPLGLRYHALHHYFPGIPYHNLAKAHRELMNSLPAAAVYRRANSPSLIHSLQRLLGLWPPRPT